MPIDQGIFSDESNFNQRYIADYDALGENVQAMRHLGLKIVLTSGSFDLIHEGHALYLESAKKQGDVLVVGVDSDDRIRERKGLDRPIVPEAERLRMLTHLRSVDLVTLKPAGAGRWNLIAAVRPDILVVTRATYSDEEVAELESRFGLKVCVLERMAQTATTERVRQMQFGMAERLNMALSEAFPIFARETVDRVVQRDN